jgi:S-adenosylmethionine-dependent methyltransferase
VHRAVAAEVAAVRARSGGAAPRVLDVGGGSGAWAVPLALLGCSVTVVDNSLNALAALERRAREAGVHGLVTSVQGDVDALADVVPGGASDLVLGHGLLEVVDDAGAALAALRAATVVGGVVSLLVAGRFAAALTRTVGGRLGEARAVLADPDGRYGPGDAVRRRLDAAGLRGLLAADGELSLELLQGDGVLECWVPGAVRDGGPAAARAVADLEAIAAGQPALLDVSARLHALARRISS